MAEDPVDEDEELKLIHLLNSPTRLHPPNKTYGQHESGIDVAFGLEESEMKDSFLATLAQEELHTNTFRFKRPPPAPQPSVKPMDFSLSCQFLNPKKDQKKNTLKLRLSGMQKTIQELERRLHGKDREILLWKEKCVQNEKQVKGLRNRIKDRPKITEDTTSHLHQVNHRRIEAKLQTQVRSI